MTKTTACFLTKPEIFLHKKAFLQYRYCVSLQQETERQKMDYCNELNESQRDAVLYNDGPSLVIAGAGSGKTRVLTYKIAYLLENGYLPSSILALTFTNKAAREMKERIAAQVGEARARYLWMGTFHSIFLRILRKEADKIGFSPNFTIYDTSDSKSLIKDILKDMKLDDKTYKPGFVQNRISNAKNRLILPGAYAADPEIYQSDVSAKVPAIRDVYSCYVERCRHDNAMDFDDILTYTYRLFNEHTDVLEKYVEHFDYVLVDEYQDTNYAQHAIVKQLTEKKRKVCVVGDDAQSIYSFRGANIDNILTFTKLYPEARLFKLEENYRSTQTIVNAANSLIEKNLYRIKKVVFSKQAQGEPIPVYAAYSDTEEGDIVTNKIVRMHTTGNYGYNDFAILYRTNAQSRIFEEALRKKNVPYRIYGGLSFYQRKEIKDIIAYFRLAVNPDDGEAMKRVINYPTRGIGNTTLGKITDAANRSNVSLWTVLKNIENYDLSFNRGTTAKLQNFGELISGFVSEAPYKNAYELGSIIIKDSGIAGEIYQNRTPEGLSQQENIEELLNGMNDFCLNRQEEGNENILLSDYLSEVSLLTDQDNDDDETPKVSLMTVHSAKGLEFKNIFVVGMEEGLFPSSMTSDSHKAIEEERRLFYVAITRAKEHCFLSYAKNRFRYGKSEFSSPSRFLKDIDTCYLSLPQEAILSQRVAENASVFSRENRFGSAESRSINDRFTTRSFGFHEENIRSNEPPSRFVKPMSMRNLKKITPESSGEGTHLSEDTPAGFDNIAEGQIIEHERFGIGEIIRIEGSGGNKKATVRFQNTGEKQLLLKFARFKIIN